MSIPALDPRVQRSMQQIQAGVAIESAGSRVNLPGFESACSSLEHRLMATKNLWSAPQSRVPRAWQLLGLPVRSLPPGGTRSSQCPLGLRN